MASTGSSDAPAAESSIAAQEITSQHRPEPEPLASSTPVEMSTLSSNPMHISEPAQNQPSGQSLTAPLISSQAYAQEPPSPVAKTATNSSNKDVSPASLENARMTRAYSTAIGPSSDQPMPVTKDAEETGPVLMITLLLTTGARHPFKLDRRYLSKRNVEVQGNDPFNLSVYKLKELILREWRDEWEAKPSSPTYIRLISFGKLLDDKAPLKDSKFNHDTPNVVHMTIKPQDYMEEEDAKGGKGSLGRDQDTNERSPGCRCVIL